MLSERSYRFDYFVILYTISAPPRHCTERTFDGGVIWCYCEWSAIQSLQLAGTKNVRFNWGLPAFRRLGVSVHFS